MRNAQGKYAVVRKGETVEELFEDEGGDTGSAPAS
jgi:hypothetical protein